MSNDATNQQSTVFVTGGAGFIGSHVVRGLVKCGYRVTVFERPDAEIEHLPPKGVEIVAGDIRDQSALERAMQGSDFVLHLAANPNLWARRPAEFDEINHQGTRNVLTHAEAIGAKGVVHVSTESILTSPVSNASITEETPLRLSDAVGPYCRSKMRAEFAAIEFAQRGVPVVIVSPTVPVGPGDYRQGPLTRLICQFARGSIRGYMNAEINLIDVRDVASGIIAAMTHGRIGHRYLLAGETWPIALLIEQLSRLTGVAAPRLRVPYIAALLFAVAEEQYCRFRPNRLPTATVTGVKLARRSQQFNGSMTASELGLRLRPCIESLREEVEWLVQQGAISPLQSRAHIERRDVSESTVSQS